MADQDQDAEAKASADAAAERRRHPRAPVDLQLRLRFSSVQQFLSAHAGDISESGMFVRGWEGDAQVGQLVTLRFDTGSERIVEGSARVVRLVGGAEPGVGLEFVDLDEQGRKLVEMIVRIKLAAG